MNILVVGDVHGCFNTFCDLIQNHWNEKEEVLIQLGDLIDRGNFSAQTFLHAYHLSKKNNTVFLKGNHEFELTKHILNGPNDNWLRQGGNDTLNQFQTEGINVNDYLEWMSGMPLKWENKKIFVSHAGISSEVKDPFEEADRKGVLWNRGPIKNINKLQIFGHTPTQSGNPEFDQITNSWNIDSGAYLNHGLSALKISEAGKILDVINVPTIYKDIEKYNYA